jgi:hypothetical protein
MWEKNYTTDLFIPLWEDSQEHIMKPTSELAEDCQFCWRECKKKNHTTDLFIPLWEDSQEHIMKPTSELAEDCQLCWWECKKKKHTIDCSHHCERIHKSISWNLRQNWQKTASFDVRTGRRLPVGGNVRKTELYHCLFIPLWEDSQEHILKPTSELEKYCQFWWREMSKKGTTQLIM